MVAFKPQFAYIPESVVARYRGGVEMAMVVDYRQVLYLAVNRPCRVASKKYVILVKNSSSLLFCALRAQHNTGSEKIHPVSGFVTGFVFLKRYIRNYTLTSTISNNRYICYDFSDSRYRNSSLRG